MKDGKKKMGSISPNVRLLADRAADAEELVEAARRRAHEAKTRFKQARKALKEAKRTAKQARKLAKAALKKAREQDLPKNSRKRSRSKRAKGEPRAVEPVSPPITAT